MSHHHDHGPVSYNRAFAIGTGLNISFVVIEAGYGIAAGSLALIADAGHNLSDVFSLLLAWGASVLAGRSATDQRTYGFRKATVMAALASAVLLLVALGGIAWEALQRMAQPEPVQGMTVIVVAGIGVVINAVTAMLFAGGHRHDLNIRGAFLHMVADAAISVGVVLAGMMILWQGWLWVDPVVSLLIVAVIFLGTWSLLRDSFNYATDAVPPEIDLDAIREMLMAQPRVLELHDLHVWPLSTTEVALTVHLVVAGRELDNTMLTTLQQCLRDGHGIEHTTIQIESDQGRRDCALDADCGG